MNYVPLNVSPQISHGRLAWNISYNIWKELQKYTLQDAEISLKIYWKSKKSWSQNHLFNHFELQMGISVWQEEIIFIFRYNFLLLLSSDTLLNSKTFDTKMSYEGRILAEILNLFANNSVSACFIEIIFELYLWSTIKC